MNRYGPIFSNSMEINTTMTQQLILQTLPPTNELTPTTVTVTTSQGSQTDQHIQQWKMNSSYHNRQHRTPLALTYHPQEEEEPELQIHLSPTRIFPELGSHTETTSQHGDNSERVIGLPRTTPRHGSDQIQRTPTNLVTKMTYYRKIHESEEMIGRISRVIEQADRNIVLQNQLRNQAQQELYTQQANLQQLKRDRKTAIRNHQRRRTTDQIQEPKVENQVTLEDYPGPATRRHYKRRNKGEEGPGKPKRPKKGHLYPKLEYPILGTNSIQRKQDNLKIRVKEEEQNQMVTLKRERKLPPF